MEDYTRFETALKFLSSHMPVYADSMPKPTLMHSIRVGFYLFENNYALHVSIAGLLHDILEDTDVTPQDIENQFGKKVREIVVLNTKKEKGTQYIQALKDNEEALIVAGADAIDGLQYYEGMQDRKNIRYCTEKIRVILQTKHKSHKDPIFEYLDDYINADS